MANKKTKLESMTQSHGKTETFEATTLDQILGDTGLSKYGTMNVSEYKKKLDTMPKSDLQAHATKVGLVPIDDRERMIKRLVHEFTLYVAQYRYPVNKEKAPEAPIEPEIAAILARGR